MIFNTYGGAINVYSDFMSADDSRKLIEDFESISPQWVPSVIGGNLIRDESTRSNFECLISENNDINLKVRSLLSEHINHYLKLFNVSVRNMEPPKILKYNTGEHFGRHQDTGPGNDSRIVSAVLYLNPTDYEGGDLTFTNFDLNLKHTGPSLVIFPSNYAYEHIAHPVESGTKYSVVTWMTR
jgi:predicted 2-oxoglutarate/Fe(II)-dependent dioxygenase YbiX